ncbi:SRPBCC family protein [Methylobacterium sp. ID0610]|uniref:SRPBCC family protein n=1 Tax=Methylobacterium carpenticola TaxID=3344827 RepID=UPI0036C1321D
MRVSAVALILACLVTAAPAHGPTPQKIEATATIAAPPGRVWGLVSDFAGIERWHPAVATSEGSGGTANGATRAVTLKRGGVLRESLDEYDAGRMTYSYRLSEPDLAALPVSSYSATITVTPDGAGAKVAWFGRFYRGDTGNEPPEELSDAAGRAAMKAYVETGLAGLKAKAEGGS